MRYSGFKQDVEFVEKACREIGSEPGCDKYCLKRWRAWALHFVDFASDMMDAMKKVDSSNMRLIMVRACKMELLRMIEEKPADGRIKEQLEAIVVTMARSLSRITMVEMRWPKMELKRIKNCRHYQRDMEMAANE